MFRQTDDLIDRKTDQCVCVCVCVRRSPQEETRLLMEPIAEENIEMPEAQTDTESRDMLRCLRHTHTSVKP